MKDISYYICICFGFFNSDTVRSIVDFVKNNPYIVCWASSTNNDSSARSCFARFVIKNLILRYDDVIGEF